MTTKGWVVSSNLVDFVIVLFERVRAGDNTNGYDIVPPRHQYVAFDEGRAPEISVSAIFYYQWCMEKKKKKERKKFQDPAAAF